MNKTFDSWFAENKDSELLRDMYNDCKLDAEQMGFTVGPFKEWARSMYRTLGGDL